ncbi:hypothetical protein [Asticcacaulis sp. EMRT-3]|uniref:hypothetical protein n=1 Tax=Asticcacaulis sp. EMRT-3 TaxID=3040349 RepID=UPI0024AFCE47|nr:hypothetical protein [Asticcacaulis sp. EMRT-3]MDI7776260.1 hypothetical protein [Asticcacaulis sp. EMRT-3]
MTSISAVSAYSPTPAAAPVSAVGSDHDGDNDAGQSKVSESAESSRGPATTVTLSPQAQALMAGQKG